MRVHALAADAHSGPPGELDHAQLLVLEDNAIGARHVPRRILRPRLAEREVRTKAAEPCQQELSAAFAEFLHGPSGGAAAAGGSASAWRR